MRMQQSWPQSQRTAVTQGEALAVDDVDHAGAQVHANFQDAVKVLVQAHGLDQRGTEQAESRGVAVPRRLCLILGGKKKSISKMLGCLRSESDSSCPTKAS